MLDSDACSRAGMGQCKADRLYGGHSCQDRLQGGQLRVVLQLPSLHLIIGTLQSCHNVLAGGVQAWQLLHALLQVQVRASDPVPQ